MGYHKWTNHEEARLSVLAGNHTVKEIAERMGLTPSAIAARCSQLNIQPLSDRTLWPKHMRRFILEHSHLSDKQIAQMTGKPEASVRRTLNSVYGPGWRKRMKQEAEES